MPEDIFTHRQQEIWNLMLERRTHDQIARELKMATRTVQGHLVQIWDRLCVNPGVYPELLQQLLEGKK